MMNHRTQILAGSGDPKTIQMPEGQITDENAVW